MSTQQINTALNNLRSSVSTQVRNIKKDVSNFDTYKNNYDAIYELPLVQQLLKENKKLKSKNRKLEKRLLDILLEKRDADKKNIKNKIKNIHIKSEPTASYSSSLNEVVIIDQVKDNIVYEILENEEEEEFNDEPRDMCRMRQEEEVVEVEVECEEDEEVEEVEVDCEEEEVVEVEVEEEEEEEVEVEVECEEEEEEEEVEVECEEEEEEVEVEVEGEVECEEEEEVEVEVEVEGEVECEEEEVEVEEYEEEGEEEEEVEVEEGEEEPDESGEVYEVVIKGKTYYVTNETDSDIYDINENGNISIEVSIYKNGKPVFNKK